MNQIRIVGPRLLILLALASQACRPELSPEQKQLVADLKHDLGRIREEIGQTAKEDAAYSGGLIKALIAVRLEVLKTNDALVEQRIHSLEAGTRMTVVVKTVKTDPQKASDLDKEIESQKGRVAEARAEADRFSGGLVKAMAETTVATSRNTLAMLEQQYFIAKYGLAMPIAPSGAAPSTNTESKTVSAPMAAAPAAEASSRRGAGDCLKIETFDSSILSANDAFTELAWKVDVSNPCGQPFQVRVTFKIYDKDDFELDSDSAEVYVPAEGTGKARGKMLVSPPGKAQRMARQGASLSLR